MVPAEPTPVFCPRCRKSREPADGFSSAACPACGERLIDRGYCPVCEAYLPLAAGAPCPKHDIKLEAGPPPQEPIDPEIAARKWVTVGRFADVHAAHARRIRLEAEGIPAFIEGERMGSRSMYSVATGGARLKVPEHLAGDARIILSQTWSATAAALDIDDWHDEADAESEEPLPEAPGEELTGGTPEEDHSVSSGLLIFLLAGLPAAVALLLLLRQLAGQQ
ncbi:MAG: hypothetical protein U0790_06275 [Isosphaeraceae bacterium]